MKQYIVVENAGYEGECDRRAFDHWHEAWKYMCRVYTQKEIEDLHVDICTETDGEREYVY